MKLYHSKRLARFFIVDLLKAQEHPDGFLIKNIMFKNIDIIGTIVGITPRNNNKLQLTGQ